MSSSDGQDVDAFQRLSELGDGFRDCDNRGIVRPQATICHKAFAHPHGVEVDGSGAGSKDGFYQGNVAVAVVWQVENRQIAGLEDLNLTGGYVGSGYDEGVAISPRVMLGRIFCNTS